MCIFALLNQLNVLDMYTISELKGLFNKFNAVYFDNELPMPKIEYCNARSYMGIFYNKGVRGVYVIKISKYYDVSNISVENTLIHEMIHLWQAEHNYRDAHGFTFKSKMFDINKKGIHRITVCDEETHKISKSNIKPVYLVYGLVSKDVVRFSKATNIGTMYDILEAMKRYYPNVEYKCCVIRNEKATKCKACRTRLTYYKVTKSDWDKEYLPTISKHL